MSWTHTIFDTRRLNMNDTTLPPQQNGEDAAKAVQIESDLASSFLAERGELSSASKQYLWH